MVTIRLWAFKVAPINDGAVGTDQFRAIDICQNTAVLLANMFKGKSDSSFCGVVQYSDSVILDRLSEKDEQFILNTYPFVTVRRPLFGDKCY